MTKLTKNLLTTAGLLTLMTWSAACATNQEEGTAQAAQVNAMMNAQAAAGARADATLYPFHFEGARLNSTGQEKLDRMLPDENGASHDATAATTDVANASPMTVYLDVPADDANRRSYQDAVVKYLGTVGVAATDVNVVIGPNPNAGHPSAERVAQMVKMDAGQTPSGGSNTATGTGFGIDASLGTK